jgi:hypothetical protein
MRQESWSTEFPTRDRHELNDYLHHPYAEQTDYFCRCYDQNSFDPEFPLLPLESFRPIVRRFFTTTAAA